jgi:hypothetical protein
MQLIIKATATPMLQHVACLRKMFEIINFYLPNNELFGSISQIVGEYLSFRLWALFQFNRLESFFNYGTKSSYIAFQTFFYLLCKKVHFFKSSPNFTIVRNFIESG